MEDIYGTVTHERRQRQRKSGTDPHGSDETNKEFQIMITVPASGASSLSEMAKEEETAVKPAAAHNLEKT